MHQLEGECWRELYNINARRGYRNRDGKTFHFPSLLALLQERNMYSLN